MVEQGIEDTRAELAAEREQRRRFEQAWQDSDTRTAEQLEFSQQRITTLENRLDQAETLLALLREERCDLAAMIAKTSTALAAREPGAMMEIAVPAASEDVGPSPQEVADRVSQLLADGHVEEADRLLSAEAQRRTNPRELLTTMGYLREKRHNREARSLSSIVGRCWSPRLLAQLLAIRADTHNQKLLEYGYDNTEYRYMYRSIKADETDLLDAIAERQDSDLVEFVMVLRDKHLYSVSARVLNKARKQRYLLGKKKALLNALRDAGLVEEADEMKWKIYF